MVPLAPIALVVSIVGMRGKHNFGFAIAGFSISGFQTIALVVAIIWLVLIGQFAWWAGNEATEIVQKAADDMKQFAMRETTKATIDIAEKVIDDNTRATDRLPDEEEGNEMIKHHKDAWGKPLRFEHNTTEQATYSIRSAGRDGQWDTDDDIGQVSPTSAPANVPEALALLNSLEPHRKEAGLDWANETSPDEHDARKMIDALIALLGDENVKSESRRALSRWISDDDLPRLIAATERTNNPIDGALIIEILAERDDREGVLALINHPYPLTRNKADAVLRKWDVEAKEIVEQCLRDFDTPPRQRAALQRLDAMEFDEMQKTELADALYDALSTRTITAACIDLATSLYVKLTTVDEEGLKKHVTLLNKPAGSIWVEEYLTRLGPVAEPFVIPLLNEPDVSARINAIDVLTDIGTQRSVPHLQKLVDDRFVGERAKRAIQAIESAGREPADLPVQNTES